LHTPALYPPLLEYRERLFAMQRTTRDMADCSAEIADLALRDSSTGDELERLSKLAAQRAESVAAIKRALAKETQAPGEETTSV